MTATQSVEAIADIQRDWTYSFRVSLLSSSTKRRIFELSNLTSKLRAGAVIDTSQLLIAVKTIASAAQHFRDRNSRRAVSSCFYAIAASKDTFEHTRWLVQYIQERSSSKAHAPSTLLVLIDWCSVLLRAAGSYNQLWDDLGMTIIHMTTTLLDQLGEKSRRPTAFPLALRKIRKGIAVVLQIENVDQQNKDRPERLNSLIDSLSAKSVNTSAANALLLGLIADLVAESHRVCDGNIGLQLDKKHYYTFFARELLGSRVRVKFHVARGLNSFFEHFLTQQDFIHDVLPHVEKSLLRTPEVVLGDVLQQLVSSVPETIDLSTFLAQNLLKPLLACLKSSDALIRNGAVESFEALAKRSQDEKIRARIAKEVLDPLERARVPTGEQKLLQLALLNAIPETPSIADTVMSGLATVVAKETSEAAASIEIKVLTKYIQVKLAIGSHIEQFVIDIVKKGLIDKRIGIRKAWAVSSGDLLWDLSGELLVQASTVAFADELLSVMSESWGESLKAPIQAAQNGLVTINYILIALLTSKLHDTQSNLALMKRMNVREHLLDDDPKSSFLFNHRVYSKLQSREDMTWALRAMDAATNSVLSHSDRTALVDSWSQATIYFICNRSIDPAVCRLAGQQLLAHCLRTPKQVSEIMVQGLWKWRERSVMSIKDTAAVLVRSGSEQLRYILRSICPPKNLTGKGETAISRDILYDNMISTLIICRPEVIPRSHWINLCLDAGLDPGEVVRQRLPQSLLEIMAGTCHALDTEYKRLIFSAACSAAADLAFVAPEVAIPAIVNRLREDLAAEKLDGIGPEEAGIFRTPESTMFVDILSSVSQHRTIDKNVKDYDTLKWEADLRAQIDAKKGATKRMTGAERAKVDEQLAKEGQIRKRVQAVAISMTRGVGIIRSLATGPPIDGEAWIVAAIDLLIGIIERGVGLIIDDTATEAYLLCAEKASARLGTTRRFIGLATLRALGLTQLPDSLKEEPLDSLVTRVLYRLRLLGEQLTFDVVSLAYILPLVFVILERGGTAPVGSDESNEQIVLVLEFLSLHSEVCSDERLPRQRLLTTIISVMQRYTQHLELAKECFDNLVHALAINLSAAELKVLLEAAIVDQKSVRSATLQAIDLEIDLSEVGYADEIWLECYDVVTENAEVASTIWLENKMKCDQGTPDRIILYLKRSSREIRVAAAHALAAATDATPSKVADVLRALQAQYIETARPVQAEKDKFGMVMNKDVKDPWENREGIALAFGCMARHFDGDELESFCKFLIVDGPLGDRNDSVRRAMIESAITVITLKGNTKVESLMELFETALDRPESAAFDKVNEAVVVLYGALARHLPLGDTRLATVVDRLLTTLRTPSEDVQYAVATCLPPLVSTSQLDSSVYVSRLMDELLHAKKYPAQRGGAYGLAGIIAGKGLSALRENQVLSQLRDAAENKKDPIARQGVYLAYELLSNILGRVFEPYAIQVIPQLLAGFGDTNADVRSACEDAAKQFNMKLSSYGVQQILPTLLEGLDETQWRSKKGACDMLGTMSHLSPDQLALRLPDIIPPLTSVLTDSHKEVRLAANRSLKQFGEVISNPEIKSVVDVLLKALSDPTKHTDEALDVLIKIQFMHYLDAPSLALVVRILERGLGDRSQTKRKSSSIIANLAHLTERKDILPHLPMLVAGLRVAVVDPVRETRATAAKALGSLVEKLGEDALPDLIPSLMAALKIDTGAGDRFGSAQALSEVLAGLGTVRLEETLPTILQNTQSSKPSTREGFMSLFIYLPVCFGSSFASYLGKIIPPILGGLADDIESIREIALRAGRLLVKNFASRAVDLLLPELERGLADVSHRIRLSSVELVGDLLFNLSGITGKADEEEEIEKAHEAGATLLEALGEERRNKVLSALYICRCDTSGLVRASAINVWKALVATPRTLKELIPTLTQLIIRRLASANMEQKVIAGNALGELIRKAGEGVMATLLPTLEEGLQNSTDVDARQGICIALNELITSASQEALEEYETTLIAVVQVAIVDGDTDVREAAADAFDSLQRAIGKRVVDQVLPHLLQLLRDPTDANIALSALLTLLTDHQRSSIILPNLLPTLLTNPMSTFNARAIASLAEVASGAMVRRLPNILNAIMDNMISCKDAELKLELSSTFDTVLLSADENDGLSTIMSVMLGLARHDDHRRRAAADCHFATYFDKAETDMSRYYPDLIRTLLTAFDDSDMDVVKAAWTALSTLMKRLRKEEMESLVISTRQVLQHVGVAGSPLPGFALPKGISAVLPVFLQGLMNGTTEQRTQSALAISDIIDRADGESVKPFVTQITGPLIRVISERSVEVKSAILYTLNNLLEKIPAHLKPFLPQLQRTFAKCLADTSSETLRTRAAKALGSLITMTPRIDPLIAELVTGSRTADSGVRTAMLKALYEVVTKAGANMSEASRTSILNLLDTQHEGEDDSAAITNARLLGGLVKVMPTDVSGHLVKTRVLTTSQSKESVLALNAVLVESPETLTTTFAEEVLASISGGITGSNAIVADNSVLAAGKYLLSPSSNKNYDATRPIFEALAKVIPPGNAIDTRRLALVVIRTVSRQQNDLTRPHLALLAPPIFTGVRDTIIPIKLSAEAAFLAIFSVMEEESVVFDKYMTGPGAALQAGPKRSMQDYFKRVALRLGAQARERREAEGGQGGLGLSSDEKEDERELWSVGKVELGDMGFNED